MGLGSRTGARTGTSGRGTGANIGSRIGGAATHARNRVRGQVAASLPNNWEAYRETYLQTKMRFKNVVALPRVGYERIALRVQRGSLRLKLGLLLLAAFLGLVGMPALVGVALNRGQRLPVLATMTTTDAQDSILVYRWNAERVVRVSLSEYLVNVLAAEVSPKAPFATLQAAAIAARTYAVRSTQHQLFSTPTFAQAHGADVTDNGVLDLPWLTAAQQQARFGAQANADTVRYQEAVASTDGEILTYQGEPILAFSFALSPGMTRDGSSVFGASVPYLKSVACPADAKNAKMTQVFRISAQTAAKELGLTGNQSFSSAALSISGRDKAGYVNTVSYKGPTGATVKTWSGPQFAALLHVPSSNFSLVTSGANQANAAQNAGRAGNSAVNGAGQAGNSGLNSAGRAGNSAANNSANNAAPSTANSAANNAAQNAGRNGGSGGQPMLVIETKGIGLGFGMSLNEAAAMGAEGKQATQILSYFYPGTALASDSKWAQSLKST